MKAYKLPPPLESVFGFRVNITHSHVQFISSKLYVLRNSRNQRNNVNTLDTLDRTKLITDNLFSRQKNLMSVG